MTEDRTNRRSESRTIRLAAEVTLLILMGIALFAHFRLGRQRGPRKVPQLSTKMTLFEWGIRIGSFHTAHNRYPTDFKEVQDP